MNLINDLIRESTDTSALAVGRPKLLTLTNAVNTLIYKDLVATQPTNYPIATLFGLRYLDPAGHQFYHTQAVYAGEIGSRNEIEAFDKTKKYNKDEMFKTLKDSVYIVTHVDGFNPADPEYSGIDEADIIFHGVIACKIRMFSDAMDTSKAESPDLNISENTFKMDRWTIEARSRKIKALASTELLQDLTAAGFGEGLIIDLLAKSAAEEINKDILQKLVTVSIRHESPDVPDSFVDLTGSAADPSQAREMYRIICEMAAGVLDDTTFRATYCTCTPKVHAMLSASGWLKDDLSSEKMDSGKLLNGLSVYVDTTTDYEYALVGTVVRDPDGMGTIGSLFYAPYTEQDGVSYHVATDSKSLHNAVMVNTRYGLSVNPYTNVKDGEQIIAGDDWALNCGDSKYSRVVGVKF